jgi:hypothetical protein
MVWLWSDTPARNCRLTERSRHMNWNVVAPARDM